MKLNWKKIAIDLAILLVPMLVIFLLTPYFPERISIHRGLNDTSIDRRYAFLLGALPYVVYKIKSR